ncbi:unnamed protein product [Prorocentrum cordatum]|uniref:Protein S-acyltransferase n=1 Tax=Prorocentrum cordatum TaxID=2364126 RepID=A0ABN9TFJ1_9DINO|nr:unnamed protein product [Polarella glacialis]
MDADASWEEWSGFTSGLAALPLTPRVYFVLVHVRGSWPWLQILPLVYMLCGMYCCYAVCPVLLNVLLAWLSRALASWPFEVIILVVFCTGIGAFLVPWVPGLTVYIFGGLVLSKTCSWGAGPETRFWVGALVNIAVGLLLKLVACAVQQKCIGELLGRSLSVRRAVGVHKPMIRCIEAELRQPGWTVGKVAILCGGPDWPTSVLAGVLRLSLWQCELGTLPIIFFVIPCALTGSFYLKKGSSPIWSRAANLMTLLSLLVSLLLWMLALWAIQGRLEKDHFELQRPLPQNAELEWLDFRDAEVARRCAVVWADVPRFTRWTFALGAVIHVLVCHVLYWMNESLFGKFSVSDDIDSLKWYGADGGLFNLWSVATLAVYGVSLLAYLQYSAWHRLSQSEARKRAAQEVEARREAWLQDYDRRCLEASDSRGRALDASPQETRRPGSAVCDGEAALPPRSWAEEHGTASPSTPLARSPSGTGRSHSRGGLHPDHARPDAWAPGLMGGTAGGGPADEREEAGGAWQEESGRAWESESDGSSASGLEWAAGDSEPVALAAGKPLAWSRGGAAAAAAADMPPLGAVSGSTTPMAGLTDARPAPLAACPGPVHADAPSAEAAVQVLHEASQLRPDPLARAPDELAGSGPPTPAAGVQVLRLVARWPRPPGPVLELAPLAPLAPTPPCSPPASPTVLTRALSLVDRKVVHQQAEPRKQLGRLYRL